MEFTSVKANEMDFTASINPLLNLSPLTRTKRYLTGGLDGSSAYANSTALVGYTTSFDRAGNKLYERHLEAESRSHLYQPFNADGSFATGYDSANRLLQYKRGVLSSTTVPYLVPAGASIATPITLPGADQVRSYGLDGLGNWKTTNFIGVGSGGSTTSTGEVRQHNYVNEITSVRDTTGGTPTTTPFAYDHGNNAASPDPVVQLQGNGNLVNDGVRIYQYDAFNRLIQVSKVDGGATIATYVYDALNRRIQKTISNGGLTGDIPNGTTDYLYDGQQIIEERNDSAPTVWTKVNFWGQYIDELMFFTVPTATTYRVLSDLLYRSTAIVTTNNNIVEAYDTDAYGNTLCYSGPGTDGLWFTDDDVTTHNPINSTIFTGRQFDPESQIYYYRARYYSPTMGRFISRDPLGSPTMMVDAPTSIFAKLEFIQALSYTALQTMGAKLDASLIAGLLSLNQLPGIDLSQGPNLYQYVSSNPANETDATGMMGSGRQNPYGPPGNGCPCGQHPEISWSEKQGEDQMGNVAGGVPGAGAALGIGIAGLRSTAGALGGLAWATAIFEAGVLGGITSVCVPD